MTDVRPAFAARGGVPGATAAVVAATGVAAGGGTDPVAVAAGVGLLAAWAALPPAYVVAVGQVSLVAVGLSLPVLLTVEAALLAVLLAPGTTEGRALGGVGRRLAGVVVVALVGGVAWLLAGLAGAAASLLAVVAVDGLLARTRRPREGAVDVRVEGATPPAPAGTAPEVAGD